VRIELISLPGSRVVGCSPGCDAVSFAGSFSTLSMRFVVTPDLARCSSAHTCAFGSSFRFYAKFMVARIQYESGNVPSCVSAAV